MAQTCTKLLLIAIGIGHFVGSKKPPIVFSEGLSERGREDNGYAYE